MHAGSGPDGETSITLLRQLLRTNPPWDNAREGFLKDVEYAKLSAACRAEGPEMSAMFEAAYVLGWRAGELLDLDVSQLDFVEGSIRLTAQQCKNKSGRIGFMSARMREALLPLCQGRFPHEKVFPGFQYRRPWERATKAAGLEGLLFHDLRRTASRNLVRAGNSEGTAMAVTGHKTASVFRRYAITTEDDVREALARVERRQKGRPPYVEFYEAHKGHLPRILQDGSWLCSCGARPPEGWQADAEEAECPDSPRYAGWGTPMARGDNHHPSRRAREGDTGFLSDQARLASWATQQVHDATNRQTPETFLARQERHHKAGDKGWHRKNAPTDLAFQAQPVALPPKTATVQPQRGRKRKKAA